MIRDLLSLNVKNHNLRPTGSAFDFRRLYNVTITSVNTSSIKEKGLSVS